MKKLLGLLALVALVATFAFEADFGSENFPAKTSGLKVGDTAPDFKLKNVDGKMVSLSDYKDVHGFIIAFTCNTCPFSKMYENRLIELHKKYAPKGWPVVAINPNDSEVKAGDSFEAMQRRAKEKNYPFVYLDDEGQKVYPQYGAERTPHIYLLNDKRIVEYIGAIDNNPQNPKAVTQYYVEDAIAAVEKGEKPDPDFTKAIGCTIKGRR